jgi:hypothetical protein
VSINRRMAMVRRLVPRPLRAHAFVTALVVGALIGGGLRLVPTSASAATGSNAGQGASTACAAK